MGHSKQASSSNSLHPLRRPSHTLHLAVTPSRSLRAHADFGEHWVWRYRSPIGPADPKPAPNAAAVAKGCRGSQKRQRPRHLIHHRETPTIDAQRVITSVIGVEQLPKTIAIFSIESTQGGLGQISSGNQKIATHNTRSGIIKCPRYRVPMGLAIEISIRYHQWKEGPRRAY